MKRSTMFLAMFVMTSFLTIGLLAAEETGTMRTAHGRVISIDPEGKAITIATPAGTDVGTIVNQNTKIRIKGKLASLKDINEGDAVTIRYLKSDDLYAKEVVKKK
ncbi:MAG: hypothetical protein GYA56_02130 [Geobacteraceae bacterium]|jgi:Cu/Ag efflux protein CusF|nr:hypothetical protein [Geobacteraceae bacterium]OPX97548.1 MAG: hypothetical protein A4E60_03230 [Syntrophorhabdus sp. PtaB.Bin047]